MINIAKLLKDAPKGMKLYSPLFGEVTFGYVSAGNTIWVTSSDGKTMLMFTRNGKYCLNFRSEDDIDESAECLLFPGKGQTWSGVEIKHPYKKKFEVGNWITDGWNPPVKVSGFSLGFTYYFSEGNITSQGWSVAEDDYHLWTIADAKDGDVLALNGKPFIYSSHKYGKNYCYIDECGQLRVNFSLVFEGNYVCPATKQERDLLFSKMREVGYEWDADKKELHKIKSHYDISNFHAGMPVLVRDGDCGEWKYVSFSHYRKAGTPFCAGGQHWFQCIPFNEETKHLLGTTDMPSEEFIN